MENLYKEVCERIEKQISDSEIMSKFLEYICESLNSGECSAPMLYEIMHKFLRNKDCSLGEVVTLNNFLNKLSSDKGDTLEYTFELTEEEFDLLKTVLKVARKIKEADESN